MKKLIVRGRAASAFVLLAAAMIAAPVAAQQPMPAQAAQTSALSEDTWPHTFTGPSGGTATVYQPQVVSWPDFKTLNARTVIAIAAKGASAPTLGTIELAFTTQTSLEDRVVTLTEPRLVASNFPTLDAARAAEI
ncbi:MAG TPA: hypothetical protein VFJ48_02015, partial [Casimicrobiaceae bacterium]|nr:hypothetical protein [Casimicrobiaceae bacterium]